MCQPGSAVAVPQGQLRAPQGLWTLHPLGDGMWEGNPMVRRFLGSKIKEIMLLLHLLV